MKQLTLIKVAGVVISMAAFGGGMANADPVVEHTADYTEVNEHGTSTGVTHDDAEFDSLAGAFEKVEGSDKITVDDIELAQQSDQDKLATDLSNLQSQVDALDTSSTADEITAAEQAAIDQAQTNAESTAAGNLEAAVSAQTTTDADQNTAIGTAQTTANTAVTKAEAAGTQAVNALGAASTAQTAAEDAQTTANTAKSTADGNTTHLGTLGDKVDALEAKTAGISNNNGNIGISAGDGTVIVATDNFYVEDSEGNAELVATEDYVDAANNAQDTALATGVTTAGITVENDDSNGYVDIEDGYVEVYTDDAETYIDEYGVTVYQYNGKGDVSVDNESLLNNAEDIDALEDSAVSIDENGQVSTKGHSNTYEVNGYTYTDNGYGSYTTDDPAQEGKFFTEGYLADTLGGTVTNAEVNLATDAELAAAIESIETGDVDLDGYATEDYVDEALEDTVQFDNNGDIDVDGGDLNDVDDIWAEGDVTIEGTLTVGGEEVTSGVDGKDGAKGEKGDTGAAGRDGRDGRDGQDATITFNSEGQAVLSAANGSVAVATDEQVTITRSELTALIESVAATAAAEVSAEAEARIEEIQEEAAARIAGLAAAAEERIQIKRVAVANTVAIVTLEDQWNTDPVLGNYDISKVTGQRTSIEVANGVFEYRVARVEDIQTIADRVADNTSRIQRLENAVFVNNDNDSVLDRLKADLWSRAKIARKNNAADYVMTSAGLVDLRGHTGGFSSHAGGTMISLSDTMAYDVLGLNSTWVALK